MSRRLIGVIAAIGAAGILFLWGTNIPLGVPAEWTWPRIPFSAETVTGWMTALIGGGLYFGYVLVAGARQEQSGRIGVTARMIGLALCGAAWLVCLMSAVPGIAGLSRSPFVLYYQRSSGYFWQARYEVHSTRELLATYEKFVAQGDYLHQGTHPPGLILFFRGLIAFADASPAAADAIVATEPESVRNAADTIRAQSLATTHPFTRADEACLWLATLLAILIAALGVAPLYGLLRENHGRQLAWQCAALWPLVPALAVFLPKSDAVFPTIGLLGVWLWRAGRTHNSWLSCGAAGLVLGLGMTLSLALAPIALFAAVWTALDELTAARAEGVRASWRIILLQVVCAAAGFIAPALVTSSAFGLNLISVWSWNVHNHAEFYRHFDRTWWKWLLVNPVETAFAAGLPLAATALVGAFLSRNRAHRAFVLSLAVAWGLLWLSGKNMGEAARLWIVFLPWLIIPAAAALDRTGSQAETAPRREFRYAAAVLIVLQLLAAVTTATRVDGFQFDELRTAATDHDSGSRARTSRQ